MSPSGPANKNGSGSGLPDPDSKALNFQSNEAAKLPKKDKESTNISIEELLQEIGHLSREQQVLRLNAHGYSTIEIAKIMGTAPSTVRTQKHRARARVDTSQGVSGFKHWPSRSFMALLSDVEQSVIVDIGTRVRFPDDSVLVRQGDYGSDLFVPLSGLVKMRVASWSGSSTVLSILSRGDLVGEFAVIDDSPREATAIAVGDVEAIRLNGTTFMEVLRTYPDLRAELTKYVVGKVRSGIEKQTADRFSGARVRLAHALYDLATNHLEQGNDGVYRLQMTMAGIGELAGVGQSTTERELAKLRDEGAIDTHYRLIEIHDLRYLAGIAFAD